MVSSSVLTGVRRYLRALEAQGIKVSFGVIFGSQVAGATDEWSDIDLMIVSPHFDLSIEREDVNRLWRLAARIDSRIEPFACGEEQWKKDTSNALVEIARRQGTCVTLKNNDN
ncbi:MAG: nucleotidyltransferase domain-containing protein [Planctomycetes bacterium]|nr:nucleotidyltransferase domain-containing protein [Planctomycetota bacterium]